MQSGVLRGIADIPICGSQHISRRSSIHRQKKETAKATTAAAIASIVRMPSPFASQPLTWVCMIA
jgi:hypothetical protein